MNWYYALNDEQKGPVEQAEFDQLRQQGIITAATLVWREGLANWQPYSQAAGPQVIPAPPPVAPVRGGVVCSECGVAFAPDQVIRIGDRFICAGCKPIAVQKLREGVVNTSTSEQIRKDHIKHEASIKSVGFLYFLGATFLLLGGVGGLAASFGGVGASAVLGTVLVVLGAILIWTGIGLRQLKPWARIPSGIFAGLGLLGFPMGTLINGYILYLLFSKKGSTIFSDDYKQVIEETPHIKYRTPVLVWILLGVLLLLLLLTVGAAFFAGVRARR